MTAGFRLARAPFQRNHGSAHFAATPGIASPSLLLVIVWHGLCVVSSTKVVSF